MTTAGVPASFTAGLERLRGAAGGHRPLPRRQVFELAKATTSASLDEIEAMLDDGDRDVRTGGVCIMDFQARRRGTAPDRRRGLYDLYLRRHDRIDTWDLVDRAAPHVVGGYLVDRPRDPLYDLARSPHWWERRTAIVATWFFIRRGDLDDTFALGAILVDDPEHFVQTAVGGWIREAGKRDPDRLVAFLDQHAATMPATTFRFAVERLDATVKEEYRQRRSSVR